MLTWAEFVVAMLENAEAQAAVGIMLSQMAEALKSDPWKYADFFEQSKIMEPNGLAILQRNIKAHQLMAEGLKEIRTAILKAQTAAGERGPG